MKNTLTVQNRRLAINQTFAAFQYPNYRLWFIGQLVSLVGTWMQSTAQGYLAYDLTQSTAFLGYVGFIGGIPTWIFTLYGGVIADRISRRTLMLLTQTGMMILAFLMALLVFTGLVQPWHILVIAFFLGIANAFDAPARQAFVSDLVERKDLTNAIALNSTMFNAAVVVGPLVGGVIYAALGPTWCFTLNAISFIAVIVALLLMKLAAVPEPTRRPSTKIALREGFDYTRSEPMTRALTLNMMVLSLFGISMMTLIPAWSVEVLGGDVRTNGLLLSARGVGALIGAMMIAALSHRKIRGRLWTIGSLLMPLTMIAFAFARFVPLSMAILVFTGWAFMVQINTTNALLQSRVPDQLRGRVMSFFTLTFFGFMPFGSLLVGNLAARIGEPQTIVLNAVILGANALLILWRAPFIQKLE
jgi:MFS family permease